MRQFSLAEAKAGKPVVTRSGLPVRLIYFNWRYQGYPLVGWITVDEEEVLENWTERGKYISKTVSEYDLFMAPIEDNHGDSL